MEGGGSVDCSTITDDRPGTVPVGGVSARELLVPLLLSARRPKAFVITPQQRRASTLQTLQSQEIVLHQRRTAVSQSLQLQSRQEQSPTRSIMHLHNPVHPQNITTINMMPNKLPPRENVESSYSGTSVDVVFTLNVVVSMSLLQDDVL